MNADIVSEAVDQRRAHTGARTWLGLSIAAAALAFVGSVVGLSVDGIYDSLTSAFLFQALAQDIINAVVVAPLVVLCAVLALRGSYRAGLLCLGAVAFTVYSYVIYTFSIPFGPIFPVWVGVLGLSLFALIGGLVSFTRAGAVERFAHNRATVVAAWTLLVVAGLFGLLWLSEDLPALLAGVRPQSVIDMALPTNPVHILDYAFFLPAAVWAGVGLLHRRAFAHPITAAFLVFLLLTCLPILITPFVQMALRAPASWGVMIPIGTMAAVIVGVLSWFLGTLRTERP
ncbi:hypothetical protein E3O42_16700 [Cryobacterium adonitolivorans]|uniref:Uncharacterized protein n=1 Tax=Cryobacterium adonitolivorans TaxID=1259189 RepID=A0A4R8W0P0_9MICO|nr:hypothetical protein [Cryobacterium adonitolivorans]TFB96777.1 hypothetical protein E3O42_16700 [Cryobacterium adonitolivorans]